MASKPKLITASGDELAGIRQVCRSVLPNRLRWRVPQSEHTGTRPRSEANRRNRQTQRTSASCVVQQSTSRQQRGHSLANRNDALNTSLDS
jgi:hypothetical protein